MVSENRGVRPAFLTGAGPANAWPEGCSCAANVGSALDNWKGATKGVPTRSGCSSSK